MKLPGVFHLCKNDNPTNMENASRPTVKSAVGHSFTICRLLPNFRGTFSFLGINVLQVLREELRKTAGVG